MSAETPTAQEVFGLAVGGVLKQGKRCVDSDGTCLYRGPNGSKCAAGFVFTDEEVDNLEGGVFEFDTYADTVVKYRAPRLSGHVELLTKLQLIHDIREPEDWPRYYRDLATSLGLSTAVIDQWEAQQDGGAA